jgi:hypothetical protein
MNESLLDGRTDARGSTAKGMAEDRKCVLWGTREKADIS